DYYCSSYAGSNTIF
nr:immunoglobulin light chain junction region [Macaca mulatta]MOW60269.1 immunoglobulin light chain junction region [Macaca mulatta]